MRRGTTLKILDEEGDFSPFPIPQKESVVKGDEVSWLALADSLEYWLLKQKACNSLAKS